MVLELLKRLGSQVSLLYLDVHWGCTVRFVLASHARPAIKEVGLLQ